MARRGNREALTIISWRDIPAALPWGLAGGVLTAATALALAHGVTAVLSSYTGQRRIRDIVSVLVFIPLMLAGVILNQIVDSFDQLVALADLRGRCVMTTFDPDTLQQDPRVLKDIVRRFGGRLALNADVVQGGTLVAGDPVALLSEADARQLAGV